MKQNDGSAKIWLSHFKCLGFFHSPPKSFLLSNICFIISSSVWIHQKSQHILGDIPSGLSASVCPGYFPVCLPASSPLGVQCSVSWMASRFWRTCSSLVNGCSDTPVIFSVPPARTREPSPLTAPLVWVCFSTRRSQVDSQTQWAGRAERWAGERTPPHVGEPQVWGSPPALRQLITDSPV